MNAFLEVSGVIHCLIAESRCTIGLYTTPIRFFPMKTVYFRSRSQGGIFHSLYKELIEHPPEGYQILLKKPQSTKQTPQASPFTRKQQLAYDFDIKVRDLPCLSGVWHEIKTLSYMVIKRIQSPCPLFEVGADLIYSSQQLTFAKLRWVVDFEFANALVDYGDIRLGTRYIQKALASKYCKKVLPWSNWAKRTLERSVDCDSFKEKIETVHFGITPKDLVKKKNNDKLRLLFVGSINILNYLNFEWKGGFEVVEAFLELNEKYDGLEVVLRSWVPPEIIERCSSNPNIKILYSPLSEEALANLYASSDIVLFPAHLNLGMAILEAMSYELPVVARGVYDVSEAVEDEKTGILLSPLPKLPYYLWNGAPNHRSKNLLLRIRQYRPLLVKQIVEKVSLLIEDGSLRRRIGREARHLIEEGEFSIKNRNRKLKRIFDEAIEED